VYTIHATKKLLDRVKQPLGLPVEEPSTALGNWYATVLFWKPQVVLFVNERTLLPVFVPLAPAAKLAGRLPDQLGRVLGGLGVPVEFVLQEVGAMSEASYATSPSWPMWHAPTVRATISSRSRSTSPTPRVGRSARGTGSLIARWRRSSPLC
jgi:hypothetical protein